MNTLSQMIFLADIVGKIEAMFFTLACMAMLAAVVFVVSESRRELKIKWQAVFFALFSIAAFSAFTVTPSKTAIYMMAASEVGEATVTSPEARDMLNDLREIIARKLKAELGEVRT